MYNVECLGSNNTVFVSRVCKFTSFINNNNKEEQLFQYMHNFVLCIF